MHARFYRSLYAVMYIMSQLAYCVCITCSSQDQNSRWIQMEAPYAQEPLYTLRLLSQTHTRHSDFLVSKTTRGGKKTTHSFKSSKEKKKKKSNFLNDNVYSFFLGKDEKTEGWKKASKTSVHKRLGRSWIQQLLHPAPFFLPFLLLFSVPLSIWLIFLQIFDGTGNNHTASWN